MAFKLNEKNKKIVEGSGNQNSAAPISNSTPVQKPAQKSTSSQTSTPAKSGGFKLNDKSRAIVESGAKKVNGPKRFMLGNNVYAQDETGSYIKDSYIKKQRESDRQKELETGHETFLTDLGQATEAGLKGWVAPQLSTLATVPLAISAAVHGDNYYEPTAGSGLWKMLNASHAENQEAGRLREASTEGRGQFGSTLLEGYSSAVTNGIDTALSLIPVVGPTLTKVSFASRSFGGSAQQARDEGKSVGTQVLSGAVSAAIESITENIWTYGGVRDLTGGVIGDTGPLGNLTNKLESAMAKKAGPIVSRLAMTFGTEAVEEMMADVLNPVAKFAIDNTLAKTKLFEDYEGEAWQGFANMFHDGIVGGIAGILGGVSSAVEAVNTYKASGSNNALYSAAIRNEFEQQRAEARANKQVAKDIRNASLGDAIDSLFNRTTGKTVSERVSEATGRYVSRKDAYKMVGQMDQDYSAMCEKIAKKFADDSFSNEVVNKDVLEKAVYKYLVAGEFAESLDSIEGAREQIKTLSKDIMTEWANQQLEEANGKKNKAKAAFYTSLLSQMVNQNLTAEQAATEEEEDFTARPFRTNMEDLSAEQQVRDAELHPEQEAPAWQARVQQAQTATEAQDNDVNINRVFTAEEQATIMEKTPELWNEYRAALNTTTGNTQAGVAARVDRLRNVIGQIEQVLQGDNTTSESTQAEQTEQAPKLSKTDQRKVDQLFDGTKRSLIPSIDEKGKSIVDAIYARAKQEGKEVISKQRKDGRYRYTINDGSPLFEQSEKILDIADKLGIEVEDNNVEAPATVKLFSSGGNNLYQNQNRPLSKTLKLVLDDKAKTLNGSELNDAFKYTLDKAGLNRNSQHLLDDISDFIFGNFESQTSQQVIDTSRQEGEKYLTKQEVDSAIDAELEANSNVSSDEAPLTNLQLALFKLIDEFNRRRFDINKYLRLSSDNATENQQTADESESEVAEKEYAKDDATGEIIQTLHESYGDDFPTEDAVNLRSSLMSGFAPSDKFGVGDLSVNERLDILREAFPDEDFSISHYNKNEIVDSSTVGEYEEAQQTERGWNRRNLKSEAENPAKNAFGTLKANPDTEDFGGTKVAGWVDTGKANQENISVADKVSALDSIRRGEEAKQKIKSINSRISTINKAVDNIKAVLDARKNRLVDYAQSEISRVETARDNFYEMLEDLDAISRYGYVSSSPNAQDVLSRVNYEKAVLSLALKEIQRTDASRLYDDELNKSLVTHLENLASEAKELYTEIDRQQKLVKQAGYRETQRSAIKETWLDQLSESELKDFLFDKENNQYYGNLILTKEELAYARDLYRENYERNNQPEIAAPKQNAGLGDVTGENYNVSEAGIYGNGESNDNTSDRVERQARGGYTRRGTRYYPQPADIRPMGRGSRFSIGSGRNGRVSYDGTNYLSIYDDYDGGKQVATILTKKQTVGKDFDDVREYFKKNKRVKKVIFAEGKIFDSARGQLCNGVKIEFANGDIAIVLAADNSKDYYKAGVHEDTHINIDAERANGNFLLAEKPLATTLKSIFRTKEIFQKICAEVADKGGYSTNNRLEVFDEIVANINAGINAYGIDFGAYKDALVNSRIYKSVSETAETDKVTVGVKRMAAEIPTLNEFRNEAGETSRASQYGMEDNEADEAKGSQRIEMDEAEYNELRQADKAVTTLRDFERQQAQQPTANKKVSAAEAWETAQRIFGTGHKRVTRATKNFQKISNPFADTETYGSKGKNISSKLDNMFERLVDVNDGYGTIQSVLDEYETWRDTKSGMSDYYNEEVADRFRQILEDAENNGWTFGKQQQNEISQAFEEAVNTMTADIDNTNRSSTRLIDLATEAKMNKLNVKADTLVGKAIQKFIRMQISTDTAMKMFGGFKGSGEFYKLGQQIKDSVTKRMTSYIEAQSYFDGVKKMDGFKEFADNTKTYDLSADSPFLQDHNPLKGHEFTLQQIVTMNRLFKTLRKTFENSDVDMYDRIKGFVFRDAKGNSFTIDVGSDRAVQSVNEIAAIQMACENVLSKDTPAVKAANEYSKACDRMFKMLGKEVSAVKKALTGNGLSLIGENYTPVLWANEDGTPADFNFNDDDTIRPPSFLYKRTAKQGHLVVSDISYIVDKYIENASDYIGTAQMKDMLRRLNNGNSIVNDGKGLNSTLAENFGKEAGSWFNEYVKDLTEYGENDSIWAALRRNMQKGALIGSPSVMMKQTSSYWSAMGLLSPEALVTAYRWKVGAKAADSSEYNNLLKYRRTTNNIDPTLTEIIKGNNKYGKASNSRVFQLFTNGIAEQDFKTVDNLYTATVVDTYLKNQNRDASYFASEQFQRDIDSKFAEVMLRSQPMFDTELRAEYARTDKELVKMTSMFRTQQTQNLNLIATALGEWKAAGADTKGEKAQVLRQTVAGQASAALSLSLLTVAADIMLHGLKKYRGDGDDDDEEAGDGKIELQRILGRIGLNTVEAGAGTLWFGDQVAKWLIDRMSGGETNEFYGVNLGPLTTMKNVIDNLEYVAKSPTPSNIKNVAVNISQLMGIPLNNAYRYVNSAVMYTADLTGNNDQNYDDMLKMVGNRAKVNKKNEKGRNLLIESGMSKKEATGLVKIIDTDDDGLSKDDLSEYYIEHPEEAERVSILWDSMGWKTSFEKAQKNLDKKVVYNSNPLYAAMDADESESVSKTELTDYALEHPDQYEELEKLYDEQGWKGSFKSAIRSAEQTKLKETAEDAFYDNDYNVLFESVSQMKNGKSWLNSLIKDEYDEYDGKSNPIIRYMIDAKRSAKEVDEAVEEYGASKFVTQYKALRKSGMAPSQAVKQLDIFDANSNGSITQAELADYYKKHKDEEATIAEFWKACGWSTSWSKYKKYKKIK